MPTVVLLVALVWLVVLLVAAGLLLVRSRDVLQRLVALDVLAVLVICLLVLLCFLRDQPYYLDAAVALALLSFVATVAAAKHLSSGGPFE